MYVCVRVPLWWLVHLLAVGKAVFTELPQKWLHRFNATHLTSTTWEQLLNILLPNLAQPHNKDVPVCTRFAEASGHSTHHTLATPGRHARTHRHGQMACHGCVVS